MQQRTYVQPLHAPIYPNTYVILVAGPSVGKSIPIRYVTKLWRDVGLKVGANNVSKASLMDEMEDAAQRISNGVVSHSYHSLALGIPEFGVFAPAWDSDLMNTLNDLYDCGESSERKRSNERNILMKSAQLSMVAACTPEYLSHLLPATAWAYGFPSRCLLVYSNEKKKPLIFQGERSEDAKLDALKDDLEQITRLQGEMVFSDEALSAIEDWYYRDMDPEPTHAKLRYYNGRRFVHFMKLLMIVCASRSNDLVITFEHFEYAQQLMLEMEAAIPDIFKEINFSDENAIMEDLRHFILTEMTKGPGGVNRQRLQRFLLSRMAANRIDDFIRMACSAGYVKASRESGNTTFIAPLAR